MGAALRNGLNGCCPGFAEPGFFSVVFKIVLEYPAELCYSDRRTKKCRPLVLLGYQA